MPSNRLTCGDFGGLNAQGDPCGVRAVDGPCPRHADQVEEAKVAKVANEILDTSFPFLTPPFQRKRDKVCIVGFTGHRELALELDRDEWEIWGLNELYRYMPVAVFDRWFEVHGREYLEKDEDGQRHIHDLKSLSIPIYMQVHHEDIPASVRFPKEELCKTLDSEYFTNCPAWMLGMAIAMGFSEILMVGVDMAQDTEYSTQRPCCEYWLGRAQGAGIKAHVAPMSDLLKSVGLYGYDDEGSLLYRKLNDRLKWLHAQDNERLAALRKMEQEYTTKTAEIRRRVAMAEGALAELKLQRKSERRDQRISAVEAEIKDWRQKGENLDADYNNKNTRLAAERNQIIGGIQDVNYIMRSWLVKADSVDGGLVPDRSKDARTGIAPAGDNAGAVPVSELFAGAL